MLWLRELRGAVAANARPVRIPLEFSSPACYHRAVLRRPQADVTRRDQKGGCRMSVVVVANSFCTSALRNYTTDERMTSPSGYYVFRVAADPNTWSAT